MSSCVCNISDLIEVNFIQIYNFKRRALNDYRDPRDTVVIMLRFDMIIMTCVTLRGPLESISSSYHLIHLLQLHSLPVQI